MPHSNMTRLCLRFWLVNRRCKTEHNLTASFSYVSNNPTSLFKKSNYKEYALQILIKSSSNIKCHVRIAITHS